jgi:hypothetical protein
MVWSVSSYSEIFNRVFVVRELFGSQKSGRFVVHLIVALLSSSLAYNGFAARRQWRVRSLQYKFSEKILRRVKLN